MGRAARRAAATTTDLPSGLLHVPHLLDGPARQAVLDGLVAVIVAAPPYRPAMPVFGTPYSIEMTSCGATGWISDKRGYRYSPVHPVTGAPWPPIPPGIAEAAAALLARAEAAGLPVPGFRADTCLVNFYPEGGKLGLHRDSSEPAETAPILSLSLGVPAVFLVGGRRRGDPVARLILEDGDGLVMSGEARHVHHGIERIPAAPLFPPVLPGHADVLRINLTLRQVFVREPERTPGTSAWR